MRDSHSEFRSDSQPIAWVLRVLVALGILALLYYYSWWSDPGRITSPWRVLMLTLTFAYCTVQLVGNWLLYLFARRRQSHPQAPDGLTVDVFVTAYREPVDLVARSLSAACRMRYPHKTWLLDDGHDPQLAALARKLGTGYITRNDRTDAKAGNINAALERTDGEIIVIFDADHAPHADFLEHTLGYFSDPKIGFVQVMLTFRYRAGSWVARAASETSLDYYNPTSLGADAVGGSTLVGSNALIRRSTLESIDGYQSGLAEDLATSIAIHAKGWRSVYVAEPLAPGMAPPDLTAWFTQQLKWARGVFELLLTAYPRFFRYLTWGQRVAYAVRMTYYWVGLVVCMHLVFSIWLLVHGSEKAWDSFQRYLLHLAPLGLCYLLIRTVALSNFKHPLVYAGLLWRAIALVYATWPIYTLAAMMAVFRMPLGFRLTPKTAGGKLNKLWILPQSIALLLLGGGVLYGLVTGEDDFPSLFLSFLLVQSLPMLALLVWALRPANNYAIPVDLLMEVPPIETECAVEELIEIGVISPVNVKKSEMVGTVKVGRKE
ncbi:MAG: glycosyltransferase [Chloroflexota bacterium]